jgi:hypothetical protein
MNLKIALKVTQKLFKINRKITPNNSQIGFLRIRDSGIKIQRILAKKISKQIISDKIFQIIRKYAVFIRIKLLYKVFKKN